MEFIKKNELQLINGGYLAGKDANPVKHPQFEEEQRNAHYLVSLAKAMKTKDYVGKKADNVQDTMNEVADAIFNVQSVEYVSKPAKPKQDMRDKMTKEALAWISHSKESSEASNINQEMQKFNTINDFEKFGLYFDKGLTKMTKIYTIEQIVEAVKIVRSNIKK